MQLKTAVTGNAVKDTINDQAQRSGLLLVAHGSRVTSSNDEIEQLSTRLAKRLHRSHTLAQPGALPGIPAISQANEQSGKDQTDMVQPDSQSTAHIVVRHAFLELTEPSIPQGIDECAARGVTELIVLPYFLAAGRHVREDIPDAVEQGRKRHPQMTITVLSHVGHSESMLDLLVSMADISEPSGLSN